MILNVLVILTIALVGYIWSVRGFFSGLLHLMSVIAAGAIAFGLWETAAYAILNNTTSQFAIDAAWAVGLAVPFAVSVAVLSTLFTTVVRANVIVSDAVNYAGGGVCGAVSGFIAAGVLAISLSHLRGGSETFGAQPITYERASGALVRTSPLWVPADRIVAGLYARLSATTFRTRTPMAVYMPNPADRGFLTRLGPAGMLLKNNIRPDDAVVIGRYTVGTDQAPLPAQALLADTFDPGVIQKSADITGAAPTGNYKIEGVVLGTKAGLREKVGQVAFGRGHVQLIVRDADGAATAVQPIAAISQAQGDRKISGRWRYDASDVYISSVGGAADPPFGFEFLVPPGSTPLALVVRNIRLSLYDEEKDQPIPAFAEYASTAQRDDAVRSGGLFAGTGGGTLDRSSARAFAGGSEAGGASPEFQVSNRLTKRLVKGQAPGLELSEANLVLDGETRLRPGDLAQQGVERTLLIERLGVDASTVVVQIDVSPTTQFSLLSPESQTGDGAPALIDESGQRFQAIGFIYEDAAEYRLRYTVGSPIATVNDLPSMSRSRTDQKLTLLFRPSLGVKLKSYAVGSKVIRDFRPSVVLEAAQK